MPRTPTLAVCAVLALLPAGPAFAEASADKPACTHSLHNGGFEEIAGGFPEAWGAFAPDLGPDTKAEIGPSPDAHSGKWSLRLAVTGKAHPTEMAGVNRSYPRDVRPAGRLEARRGGFTFWYKYARKGTGRPAVQVIAMGDTDIEDTGAPRITFDLPEEHAGDGQWHEAFLKFDFTDNDKVAWVQPVLRIFDGPAEFLVDDIAYVERLGPRLTIAQLVVEEDEHHPGERGTLRVGLENTGDETATDIAVEVTTPEGLSSQQLWGFVTIPPDGINVVGFAIAGRREAPSEIGVTATCGGRPPVSRALRIAPGLEIVSFHAEPFIMEQHGRSQLVLRLRNAGTAITTGLRIELDPGEDLGVGRAPDAAAMREIPPGQTVDLRWPLSATTSFTPLQTRVDVHVTAAQGLAAAKGATVLVGGDIATTAATGGGLPAAPALSIEANGGFRIVFPPSGPTQAGTTLYGIGAVEVRLAGAWRTIGMIPALGRIVYLDAAGKRKERLLYAPGAARGKPGELVATLSDADSTRWVVTTEFQGCAGEGCPMRIAVRSRLSCSQPRKVLAFEGPMVYWGEGAFQGAKTDAILPGLEWLVDGEESSSVVDDISPAHLRYVPHPNKVTVPCITLSRDGMYYGIEWDPAQKWDGVHDRPSVVFASPNRFEDTGSHLMGLFAPSVPDWVEENEREASKPYLLEPGKTLRLRYSIFAGEGDALDGQVAWYEEHGLSEPLPMPRGDAQRELAFSMAAYTDSLFIPEEDTWWTSKGAGPLLSPKGLPAFFVDDVWLASTALEDPALRRTYRGLAQKMLDRLSLPAAGYPLAFRVGGLENAMLGQAGMVQSLITAQRPDGSWRFDADKIDTGVFKGYDYHELGPDDAAEVGTCAWNAYQVLRFARMTGDAQARAAGLKALAFMARFSVPRAAQVWEVPVHTPDVLAASDAVQAYLEGYQITGDERYLERAVYWAKAGLPFIYMWNAPEFPFMRYASIPVFGASLLKHSWFGRPVQWNGLRYGYALQQLARFDESMDWPRLAHGLMVSGMYQQAEEGEDKALWPDSIGAINADKSAWVFSPYQVNKILYTELGLDPEPQTMVLDLGGGQARLSSVAHIASAQAESGRIEATLEYPAGETTYVLVCGVGEPKGVSVTGQALARAERLEASAGARWWYDPARATLVVRVAHTGRDTLLVEGVAVAESRFLPEIAERIAFDFDRPGDLEGWLPAHHVADVEVADGALRFTAGGGDPFVVRSGLRVAAEAVGVVAIRMSVDAGEQAQLFWATDSSAGIDEAKSLHFAVVPDGEFHEYRVPVGEHRMWQGTITQLRLDPNQGQAGSRVEVDFIRSE